MMGFCSSPQATITSCLPRSLVTALFGFGVSPISNWDFLFFPSSVAIVLLLSSSGPPAALVYPTSSKRLLMHGVLDYVQKYLGPTLLSLYLFLSSHTALCAKAVVGQQRGTLACLPYGPDLNGILQ